MKQCKDLSLIVMTQTVTHQVQNGGRVVEKCSCFYGIPLTFSSWRIRDSSKSEEVGGWRVFPPNSEIGEGNKIATKMSGTYSNEITVSFVIFYFIV